MGIEEFNYWWHGAFMIAFGALTGFWLGVENHKEPIVIFSSICCIAFLVYEAMMHGIAFQELRSQITPSSKDAPDGGA